MRIVLVTELFPPHIGGVEVLFQSLAEQLAQRGHSVTVVTQRLPGTAQREKKDNYEIYRVWVPPLMGRYFFSFTALYRLFLLRKKADVIHTTTYNAALPAWLISKIFSIPAVITVHEVYGKRWHAFFNYCSALLHRLFEWIILTLPFDQTVCVSEATKSDLLQLKKECDVIYNGIDYEHFSAQKHALAAEKIRTGLSDKCFYFLYYGRPGISKGLHVFIRSFAALSQKDAQARAILLLSKKPESGYQQTLDLIAALNVTETIEIWDPVTHDDLPAAILAADCVVIPSLSEGFGFTTAESAALDMPLVVSDAGSLPEVASGKVIFCKRNSVQDLERALLAALNNDFKKISKKYFRWDNCIKSYESIYSDLIERS